MARGRSDWVIFPTDQRTMVGENVESSANEQVLEVTECGDESVCFFIKRRIVLYGGGKGLRKVFDRATILKEGRAARNIRRIRVDCETTVGQQGLQGCPQRKSTLQFIKRPLTLLGPNEWGIFPCQLM